MRRIGGRALLASVVFLAGVAAATGINPTGAGAQDPTVAPPMTLSNGGRSVSGAGKSLSASQVTALDPNGQSVTVSGNGYDVNKGVYVTFCVIPATNYQPTPCGGGQDRSGSTGESTWVSSNPPDYASGLTTPYGPGGSFTITLAINPKISDTIDCFTVRCAIVTRNDHTRSSDRSQDLFLPVTFRDPSAPAPTGPTTTTPPPVVATTTTVAAPSAIAPVATVAPDGLSTSDGTRTVAVSAASALDPDRVAVTVRGSGFDPAQGIYVALCAVPAAGAAPGPCTSGAEGAAWISSNPPDYGKDLARSYAAGGSFSVDLAFSARIDAASDCRKVACAVATRHDDTAPADRRADLLVPVAFAARSTAKASSSTTQPTVDGVAASAGRADGGSSNAGPIAGGVAALVVLGGAAVLLVRRRRA